MKTATLIIEDLGWRGRASVYRLSEPHKGYDGPPTRHVIVSAVNHSFAHETYLFPCNAEGKASSMLEMPGSLKGTTSHAEALAAAGYSIVDTAPEETET